MSEVNRQFLHEHLYRGEGFDKLAEKVVVIAGTGAIGTWVAITLARMGVRNFRLIDKDRVEIYNVSTQAFTPKNVGQYKVRALQEQLYRISKARCEVHPVELDDRNAEGLLKACDLVICSFDNQASRLRVKGACLRNSIPCVFGAMSGEHAYSEVIWAEDYNPPDDPIGVEEYDPCQYPLGTTLCLLVSSLTAEISVQFLLKGVKKKCRVTLGGMIGAEV